MKLNDIQGKEIVPEGVYTVTFQRFTLRPKDKQMLLCHFEVSDGMHAGAEITDLAMLREEKDLWKLKKILEGLQVPEDQDVGNPLDEEDDTFRDLLNMLAGAMAKISVNVRIDGQGIKRNNILSYAPVMESVEEPEPAEKDAVDFNTVEMDKELKEDKKKKKSKATEDDSEEAPEWAKDLID